MEVNTNGIWWQLSSSFLFLQDWLLYPYYNKIFYDEILSESGKYYGKVVMLVGLILCLDLFHW